MPTLLKKPLVRKIATGHVVTLTDVGIYVREARRNGKTYGPLSYDAVMEHAPVGPMPTEEAIAVAESVAE